ncbi:MAG TPA: transcription antitermination factor NusB [Solirubrobacteraceae bacterium]|jgi:N utilization substance protein B|nr:transcription antitermination factor NusB [Solirubrobacteraceae bacterium]
MRRTDQRREAVVALYQHDLTGRPLADTLPRAAGRFTRALAQAAADRATELDALISANADGWTAERLQPLERSILRVALVEMLHPDEVPAERAIPPEGAIDEAVEHAKVFCGADAPGFVNGILSSILRAQRTHDPLTG